MQISLQGMRILVTGGSRGIGAALSRALMQAGARVAVHYRASAADAEALVQAFPETGSTALQADLADPAATTSLFQQAVDRLGGLDVLVNNAGIAVNSPLDQEESAWLADWSTTLQVNLTATAQLSRFAIQHFRSQQQGRIIHISSRAAFRGDTPEYLAYAASKAGMVALHRSIARGFGKEGIKSFRIAPGFIRTDMAQDFIDTYGEEYVVSDLALNELTEAEDLAPTVVLLASGLADHATGSTIDINAGSYVH